MIEKDDKNRGLFLGFLLWGKLLKLIIYAIISKFWNLMHFYNHNKASKFELTISSPDVQKKDSLMSS